MNNNINELLEAIKVKNKSMIKMLINSGVNINAKNEFGSTPLMSAVARGDIEIVKLLLENGADSNIKLSSGKSALDIAKERKYVDIINLLGGTAEADIFAFTEESLIESRVLLKDIINLQAGDVQNPDVNIKRVKERIETDIEKFRQDVEKSLTANKITKETAENLINGLIKTYENVFGTDKSINVNFLNAIYKGDVALIEQLIKEGANVNEKDVDGMSALMCAIHLREDKDAVKLLIKNGADINAISNHGSSALMFASVIDDEEIAKILIKNGANVNIQNNDGENALMWAILDCRHKIERLLINADTDVNAQDKKGRTALMMTNDKRIVELLIKKGADFNRKDHEGKTALMKAKVSGNNQLIDLLIKAGAKE